MSDEKWAGIKEQIKEKFGIDGEHVYEDDLEDNLGNVFPGTKDVVVFRGLQGKMKLERVNHPMILEKKMHYHKGAGGTAKVEYIVSDTEKTHRITAYVWDEASDDWKELELPEETITF